MIIKWVIALEQAERRKRAIESLKNYKNNQVAIEMLWFILELKYNPYTPNERSVCHAYFCISILLTNSYALAVSLLPFTSMGTTNAENKSTFVANVSINLPLLSTLLKTLNLEYKGYISIPV